MSATDVAQAAATLGLKSSHGSHGQSETKDSTRSQGGMLPHSRSRAYDLPDLVSQVAQAAASYQQTDDAHLTSLAQTMCTAGGGGHSWQTRAEKSLTLAVRLRLARPGLQSAVASSPGLGWLFSSGRYMSQSEPPTTHE